jgi:malonate-semialdehyde dehydrogenase (acetylating)/methylmalonate-semialdehyde dehydrogenase
MSTVGHLINGQIVNDKNRTQPIFNPSTGDSTRQVALASKATVEQAIAAAQAAYPAWRATPPIKRARIMFRFKELLEPNTMLLVNCNAGSKMWSTPAVLPNF